MLNSVEALNHQSLDAFGDPEIAARIKQYELAYQLQASVPDLMDLSKESAETFELYGKMLTNQEPSRLIASWLAGWFKREFALSKYFTEVGICITI